MYYIMNQKLTKIIGALDLTGGRTADDWFMTDEIHEEIASEDSAQTDDVSVSEVTRGNNKGWNSYVTLTIPKTSQWFKELTTTGNHLLHEFEGRTQCYRITDVTIESTAYKATITAYNLALFNLKHTTPEAKDFTDATSQTVFEYIFGRTGWIIDTNEYLGGTTDFNIDGKTTANSLLQTALQTFDAEIRAYVDVYNGIVINKRVKIVDQLGNPKTGKRVEYGWNATGITKQVTDGALITKLYVFGKDDLTTQGANGNKRKSFVVDDEANDKYNSSNDLYLEGVATNDNITDANALKSWGEKLLKYYNHPRANYTVTISSDFEANIGDTVRVVDLTIDLTLASRVIQKVVSESTPTSNQITLGEFVTVRNVTPQAIDALKTQIDAQGEMLKAVNKAMSDISSIRLDVLTPDGTDFAKGDVRKRLIMQVHEGNTNIGAYIQTLGWRWHNLNTDERRSDYLLEAEQDTGGLGTWRAQIDNTHISETPELDIDVDGVKELGSFYPRVEVSHVAQCVVDADAFYYTSHALNNSDLDTLYCQRDRNFKIVSKMTIKHGGHGTNFGVIVGTGGADDKLVIQRYADKDKTNSYISVVKWQDNATVSSGFENVYHDAKYLTGAYGNDYVQVKKGDTCYIFDSASRNVNLKNALYSVNLKDVGLEKNDYYQSHASYYPYTIWCSGHTDNNAPNRVSIVNFIHGGRTTRRALDFAHLTHEYDGPFEIESANFDFQGQNLLVSVINYDTAQKAARQYVYAYPLVKRQDDDTDETYSDLGGDQG